MCVLHQLLDQMAAMLWLTAFILKVSTVPATNNMVPNYYAILLTCDFKKNLKDIKLNEIVTTNSLKSII